MIVMTILGHLISEWPRYVIVVELGVLLWCAALTGGAASARLDRDLRRRDWGLLYVIFCVVVAVATNIFTPGQDLTVGTIVLAALLVPAVIGGLVVTARIMLRGIADHRESVRRAVIANLDEVAELLTHMHHAEPCATPACARFRDRGRELAGLTPRP